ncbi:DUF1788 domain-containing protein [Mariniradius sediminis]|uniref:DUF1788 domain-containing protein n=1 Tax=Mariniradius sediminis TaxID=2909237 RepID=A0ABS9BWW5_9BACT|nr:DUF1788 domain-containing protein [Mariniradius sediminis]MCF1751373.1 DUF1788 domain-containing protein [Mariniradius sediminis]
MTETEQIHLKFSHIFQVVSSESFLKMDALGGEIPFWIAPYDVAVSNQVEIEIKNLSKKLLAKGIKPLIVDLFELSVQILESHVGLEDVFYIEGDSDKEYFKETLQSMLNIHERFIPKMIELKNKAQPQVFMIKGVGAVYPFIRSHNILNNIQVAMNDIPTLMFFPGVYNGKSLNLFGQLMDDNYYRAFNIDNFKV